MLDNMREHGAKMLAIGSILCLYGYMALRKHIWRQPEKPSSLLEDNRPPNILKICLTGGPCAGKTTAMDSIYSALSDEEINCYIVPEAATLIADSGGMLNTRLYNNDELMEFQYNLLKAQIVLEKAFLEIALNDCKNQQSNQLIVILCDRGLMDGKAYMSKELWDEMIRRYKIKESDMRDTRYDAVFHLVTAADGAPLHYNTSNNSARSETAEEAVEMDGRTREAWFGHPRLMTFDNVSVSTFDEKIEKIVSTLQRITREHRLKHKLN